MPGEILARCNGTVAVATDTGIGIVEQGGGWYGTAIFVTALVGGLGTLAGIAITVSVGLGGLVPVGIGAISIGLSTVFLRAKRRMREAGLPAPWLVIDLQQRLVILHGKPAVPLAQVRLERAFQVGSSSKALALRCPEKVTLARGTPFGDGIDELEHALRSRGVA